MAVFNRQIGIASIVDLKQGLAQHAHSGWHFVFHLSGEPSDLEIENRLYALEPKTAICLPPWQPRQFCPKQSWAGVTFLALYVDPEAFKLRVENKGAAVRFSGNQVRVSEAVSKKVQLLIENISSERSSISIDDLIFELSLEALHQTSAQEPAPEIEINEVEVVCDHRIRKAITILKENFSKEISLDLLAEECGLSRSHFFKLFRNHVGLTPNMYQNMVRFETAIKRLTQSDDSITSIGLEMGFSSQTSFTRFFTQIAGSSPSKFRRASIAI